MTDPDTPAGIAPEAFDPVVLAGEYALGLLEGAELAEAKGRLLADPEFADRVAWWEAHFAGLEAIAGNAAGLSAPSASLWTAIDRRLESHALGSADVARLREPRPATRGWNIAAWASAAALAGVAVLLYVGAPVSGPREPTTPVAASPQLIAQLSGGEGGPTLTTRIDPATQRIALKSAGMGGQMPSGMAPELWVIPAGGAPRSLGMIPAEGTHTRALTADESALAIEGAMLAITYEPSDDAPHDAPSAAPVMAAALVSI